MDTEQHEPQAKLFKTLMHPGRLAILEILRHGEECVCHMQALLGFRQAYLSQQLFVLREAGLVEMRREGWNVFYHVVEPRVFKVVDAAAVLAGRPARAAAPKSLPREKVENCRCPKCSPVTQEATS